MHAGMGPVSAMENGGNRGSRLATPKKVTGSSLTDLESFLIESGVVSRNGKFTWLPLKNGQGSFLKPSNPTWERLTINVYKTGAILFQGPIGSRTCFGTVPEGWPRRCGFPIATAPPRPPSLHHPPPSGH